MDAVVGLGTAGCAAAEKFSQYPQYEVFKIGTDLEPSDRNYLLKTQTSSEDYEKTCPDMGEFFADFNEDTNVTFIVAGGGKIAGASLRILEKIKQCKLNVLYITPDIALMGGKKYILNRISFHVLQEYARSGLFDKLTLVYNPSVENILGSLPVRGYYDAINSTLVSTIHMVNVFSNTKAVFQNVSESEDHLRICSYGVVNSDTGEEKMIFPLDNIREKVYYIGISESSLEDGEYFKTLKERMREKAKEENVKISFQINETKYEQNYTYFVAYVDEPQNENNLKKSLTNDQG